MSELAIRIDTLGKRYQLGASRERYATLGESIRKWVSLRGILGGRAGKKSRPTFWALKDVSFEVGAGEVVGIVGRNGAGKSTLLKILSRITEPTEGGVDIYGRVGSLLEVGTGFHPELTGRENVYLNGAILGMRREEIVKKFDEIVAFAGVEQFIDTPVKHYSSGMHTRLAFAVAANLEPEILIVDEVLAVGDAQFQQKCLGKMSEVARGGRTVLFVSHNMAAVRSLCSRAIVLQGGHILVDGAVEEAIDSYMATTRTDATRYVPPERGHHLIQFTQIYLTTGGETAVNSIEFTEEVSVRIEFTVKQPARGLRIGIIVSTPEGLNLFGTSDYELSNSTDYPAGDYVSHCKLPGHLFNEGLFYVSVGCDQPPASDASLLYENCLRLEVSDNDGHGPGYARPPGVIRPEVAWRRERSH